MSLLNTLDQYLLDDIWQQVYRSRFSVVMTQLVQERSQLFLEDIKTL